MSLFKTYTSFSTRLHIPDSTALLYSYRYYRADRKWLLLTCPSQVHQALPRSGRCVSLTISVPSTTSGLVRVRSMQARTSDWTISSDQPVQKNKTLICSCHTDLPSFLLVYTITSDFLLNHPPSLKFQVKRSPASPSPLKIQIHSKEEGHFGSFYTGFYFPQIS